MGEGGEERTSFEMAVCVCDIRAKDDGVEKCTRSLLALVGLELFARLLEHTFEERCSRATARAIEYQNPFILLPVIPSVIDRVTIMPDGNILSLQPGLRGNKPLDGALETLVCVSSIQKPSSLKVSRIPNGLASSWPTSFSQTLFESLG